MSQCTCATLGLCSMTSDAASRMLRYDPSHRALHSMSRHRDACAHQRSLSASLRNTAPQAAPRLLLRRDCSAHSATTLLHTTPTALLLHASPTAVYACVPPASCHALLRFWRHFAPSHARAFLASLSFLVSLPSKRRRCARYSQSPNSTQALAPLLVVRGPKGAESVFWAEADAARPSTAAAKDMEEARILKLFCCGKG